MSCLFVQIFIVAGNGAGEDTFWSQILVLVVLAVIVGIGSLIKTSADRRKEHRQYYLEVSRVRPGWFRRQIKTIKEMMGKYMSIPFKMLQVKTVTEIATFDFDARHKGRRKKDGGDQEQRDLDSGMEVLEVDFLLRVIENTESCDEEDVVMRRLGFNELVRRGQLCAASSNTLREYAVNKGNLYGKDVQCEAMKELAERTGHVSDYGFEIKEISRDSRMKETSKVRCS